MTVHNLGFSSTEIDDTPLCSEEADLSDSDISPMLVYKCKTFICTTISRDELNSASKDIEDSNGSHTTDIPTISYDSVSNEGVTVYIILKLRILYASQSIAVNECCVAWRRFCNL